MTDALLNDIPTIGDNNPPDPMLVEAGTRTDQANTWLTTKADLDKWDADTAVAANKFLGEIIAAHKALDDRRKAENREWDARQDGIYKQPLTLLKAGIEAMQRLRRGWLQREEQRLAKEAAARAAEAKRLADAAAAVIAKAEAESARKGGDPLGAQLRAQEAIDKAQAAMEQAAEAPTKAHVYGGAKAAGLRDYWSAEITDLSAAFKYYNHKSNPAKTVLERAIRETIQSIADREAKLAKDVSAAPPGITFKVERR